MRSERLLRKTEYNRQIFQYRDPKSGRSHKETCYSQRTNNRRFRFEISVQLLLSLWSFLPERISRSRSSEVRKKTSSRERYDILIHPYNVATTRPRYLGYFENFISAAASERSSLFCFARLSQSETFSGRNYKIYSEATEYRNVTLSNSDWQF